MFASIRKFFSSYNKWNDEMSAGSICKYRKEREKRRKNVFLDQEKLHALKAHKTKHIIMWVGCRQYNGGRKVNTKMFAHKDVELQKFFFKEHF